MPKNETKGRKCTWQQEGELLIGKQMKIIKKLRMNNKMVKRAHLIKECDNCGQIFRGKRAVMCGSGEVHEVDSENEFFMEMEKMSDVKESSGEHYDNFLDII